MLLVPLSIRDLMLRKRKTLSTVQGPRKMPEQVGHSSGGAGLVTPDLGNK